jgi:hypothetical protein
MVVPFTVSKAPPGRDTYRSPNPPVVVSWMSGLSSAPVNPYRTGAATGPETITRPNESRTYTALLGVIPFAVVDGQVGRGDRPAEHGRVHDVGQDALVLEQPAAADGFLAALVIEVDVDSPGEEVLGVPLGVAVRQQDEGVCHGAKPMPPRMPRDGSAASVASRSGG